LAEVEVPNALAALLETEKVTDPLQAAQLALKWAINMDPMSIRADAEDWNKQKELAKKKAEERKLEREKLKKEEEEKKASSILSL